MSGAAFDTVVVRWANGEVTVGTPAAENSLQGFIEDSSLSTSAQAIEYGQKWLDAHGTTIDQTTIGINPQRAEVTPYDGINKGDAVIAPDRSGTAEMGRIHSIGFTGLRRNGRPNWAVTLGTRRQEQSSAVARQLSKLGGSMGATFAASSPSPAPTFGKVADGALSIVNLPVADVETFSTTSPYDRTSPYRFTEPASIMRFAFQCESLVGTTATWIDLYRLTYTSGAPSAATFLERFTWPGTAYLFAIGCDHAFAQDTGYQLRCSQAGAHRLASIQPIASSIN